MPLINHQAIPQQGFIAIAEALAACALTALLLAMVTILGSSQQQLKQQQQLASEQQQAANILSHLRMGQEVLDSEAKIRREPHPTGPTIVRVTLSDGSTLSTIVTPAEGP